MSCDLITSKMPVTILPRGGQSMPSHTNPRLQDEILDEVPSWADSRTTLVCWSGPGGTGKTTVAHTIAREYDDADDLGLRSFSGGRQEIVMTTTKFCAYLGISNCGKGSISEGANLILKDASRASLMDPLSHFSFQLSKPLITTVNPADPNFIVNGLDEYSSFASWSNGLTSVPIPPYKSTWACNSTLYSIWRTQRPAPSQSRRKAFENTSSSNLRRFCQNNSASRTVGHCSGRRMYLDTGGGVGRSVLVCSYGYPIKFLKLYKSGLSVCPVATKRDHFDIVMGAMMYLRYQRDIDDLSSPSLSIWRITLRRCHSILVIPDDNSETEPHHANASLDSAVGDFSSWEALMWFFEVGLL